MLCFYKALANLKTMIWVMIYHKLISNPKYQKCVLTLRGILSNMKNDGMLLHRGKSQTSNFTLL